MEGQVWRKGRGAPHHGRALGQHNHGSLVARRRQVVACGTGQAEILISLDSMAATSTFWRCTLWPCTWV